jgi:hypothetical protein
MRDRPKSVKASQIRATIKAIVAQLDHWEEDQLRLSRHRVASNENFGGRALRVTLSQQRARAALGTLDLQDPPCEDCGATGHLTNECGLIEYAEDPSTGIHRGIVHRLFSQACDLYRLLYPRFYQGPSIGSVGTDIHEVFPVPLTGPDYQLIAISRAARDLRFIPGFQQESVELQRTICDSSVYLYYSLAFPLAFPEFRNRVLELVQECPDEESEEEQVN